MSGATPGRLELDIDRRNGTTVVRAAGEVDLENAEALAAALRTATEGSEDAVVLDLIGVPFMDSSGLQVLLVASRQLGDRLALALSSGSPVAHLLELAEVRDRFHGLPQRRGRDPRRRGLKMAEARDGGDSGAAAERLAAIVESSDDAILSKDVEGIITSWNPAAERIYGYTAAEAIGQPISILIPRHRAGEERRILARVLAGERLEHYETERVTKDGRMLVLSLTVSPIHAAGGSIVGASVIARDITARNRSLQLTSRLQELTTALSREITPERTIDVLLEQAVAGLGADAGAVGLLDRGSAGGGARRDHRLLRERPQGLGALPARGGDADGRCDQAQRAGLDDVAGRARQPLSRRSAPPSGSPPWRRSRWRSTGAPSAPSR